MGAQESLGLAVVSGLSPFVRPDDHDPLCAGHFGTILTTASVWFGCHTCHPHLVQNGGSAVSRTNPCFTACRIRDNAFRSRRHTQ